MTFDQTGAPPREQLAATVRAAVDAGVRLLDTADAYGPGADLGAKVQGENERLIAGLLDELGLRSEVLLATKGGHTRTDSGGWALALIHRVGRLVPSGGWRRMTSCAG